jgi:signal peptidase
MRRGLELGVVGLLALVIVGGVVGQPVLLSYVVTDSMEPTLDPGDGFVAVPSVVAGEPQEGDVVIYRAQAGEHAGELVTHRIVGETARGYITRGDANPFTDQGSGEPPVSERRIVAVALQLDGNVVVLPGVGSAFMAAGDAATEAGDALGIDTRSGGGVGLLVFGIGALLYALSLQKPGGRGRDRARSRDKVITTEQVVLGIALLVVLPATATMVAPAGAHSFAVVSSDTNTEHGTAVPAGTTANRTVQLHNPGTFPVSVFMDPGGPGAEPVESRYVLEPGERVEATVQVSAPEETGYYVRTVREHRYLGVLPLPVVAWLHGVHPWLPILVIDAVLAGAAGLLTLAVLGRTQIRMRRRSRRTER